MAKASDNEFPSVLFAEQASDVATPGTGNWRLFFKAGGLYAIDDAGTVVGPFGTGAATAAADVSITDAGAYFTGTDVEAALQELGAAGGGAAALVSASMYRSTAFSLTVGSTVTIPFDTDNFDADGITNTSTGEITVSSAGKYQIDARVGLTLSASTERFIIQARVNGSPVMNGTDYTSPGAYPVSLQVGGLVNLAASDVVTIGVNQVSGTARSVNASNLNSFVTIARLGS